MPGPHRAAAGAASRSCPAPEGSISTSSISSRITASPRPRPSSPGGRQRPVSRTVISTSEPSRAAMNLERRVREGRMGMGDRVRAGLAAGDQDLVDLVLPGPGQPQPLRHRPPHRGQRGGPGRERQGERLAGRRQLKREQREVVARSPPARRASRAPRCRAPRARAGPPSMELRRPSRPWPSGSSGPSTEPSV